MLGKCFNAILSTFSLVHNRSSSSTNLQTTTHSFLKHYFLIHMQNWQPSQADDTNNLFLPQTVFPYSHADDTKTYSFLKPYFLIHMQTTPKLIPSSNHISLFTCRRHQNLFLPQTLFPYSPANLATFTDQQMINVSTYQHFSKNTF